LGEVRIDWIELLASQFSQGAVDPGTGQVTLRGQFPNPKVSLLPGMHARVQVVQGIDPHALAVPQQAVRRSDAGGSEVFLVREDNRASVVAVRLGRAVEDHWLILEGVKPGDRVIVDGFQKFIAGDVVRPKAWQRSDPQTLNTTGANDSSKGSDQWRRSS
jgi:membrane fusion protein (multidrug efflux system)